MSVRDDKPEAQEPAAALPSGQEAQVQNSGQEPPAAGDTMTAQDLPAQEAPAVVSTEEQAPVPAASGLSLEQQLQEKEAYAARLSKQLQHYRSWVASVHLKVQHLNPKSIQNAKRLYIGNLPVNVTEEDLCVFLNELMQQTGAQVGPEPAVLQCHLTQERNFAFAEFRSVEEASNAMGLDGVAWRDTFLKVRRPSNYDLATSLMLGPITPDPTMDVSCLNLSKPLPEESPNKLFVGGLPCEWPEQAVRLILEPWGTIKAFNLVMDKATGNSKGYAFCEFVDDAVTDNAIAGLNGQRAGTKTLTVKRAADGARQSMGMSGMGPDGSGISPIPTPMSQPSSFDDPSSARAGAGNSNNNNAAGMMTHLSPGFLNSGSGSGVFTRKSITNQPMPSSGQSGSSNYIMTPQQMNMMMTSSMAARAQQPYGAVGMGRPMTQSHDSHMGHMPSMQAQMMQPFMGQPHPMHLNPGAFGTMLMPGGMPGGMMMQSPGSHSFHSSVDQFTPGGSGAGSSRPTNKLQQGGGSGTVRGSTPLSGGGSGSWSQQVMQSGLVPGNRPGQMQGSKGQE